MMKNTDILISKSRYLAGLRCDKLFWCKYNRKDLIPPFDAQRQAIVDAGTEVGELARKLFSDGILVDPGSYYADKTVAATKELLPLRKPLFEPGFAHGHAYALVDILVPVGEDEWDLYEVKSSTEVKEEYLDDIAIQKYVVEGSGLKVRNCYLVHLNTEYVRQGELDPQELFTKENVAADILVKSTNVEPVLERLVRLLDEKQIPDVCINGKCLEPWECDLKDHCWSILPAKDNVMSLFWDKKRGFELVKQGVLSMDDIPEGFPLTWKQEAQLKVIASGEPYLDKDKLQNFLDTLEYPLHYFDIETLWPALPLYDGISPYQQVPFQFSLHIVDATGEKPRHISFLAEGKKDPRPEFMERITANIGPAGSVIVFNKSFENSRFDECAEALPEYRDRVENIKSRTIDLYDPFRGFWVYHREQNGRAGMKSVLPALTGKTYKNLDIQDGGTASTEFHRITFDDVSEGERRIVRSQLEEYCKLDTEGMIYILDALESYAK